MAASDFFARWSKASNPPDGSTVALTGERVTPVAGDPLPPARAPLPPAPPRTLTLEDAAALTTDADFKPFMASNVDAGVKRLALKQLFADPHFNVMDGLDTYIEDYNCFVPMDAAMVAALNHGKALLDPLSQLLSPQLQPERQPPPALPAARQPDPNEPAASARPVTPLRSEEKPDAPPAAAVIAEPAAPAAPVSPPPGIHDESLPGL